MMKIKEIWEIRSKYLYLLIFFSIVLMIGAVVYYSYLNDRIIEEEENGIRNYSELKSELIQNWRKERLADANVLLNHFYTFPLADNRLDLSDYRILNEWLKVFKNSYNYGSIAYLDDDFNPTKIGTEAEELHNNEELKQDLKNYQDNGIRFTRVYNCTACSKLHLYVIVPVNREVQTATTGYFILQTNPEETLMSTVASLKYEHPNSDILYLQRINNQWYYITGYNTREKYPELVGIGEDEIGKRVANGKFGLYWGKDYQGEEVLSYTRKIPDSNFAIIVKVDSSDLMGELNFAGLAIGFLLLLSFIGTAGLFISLHKYKQSQIMKKEVEKTKLENKLTNRIDHILENANDIVLTVNANGKILKVNKKALSTYGYTREEMLAMHITDIRAGNSLQEFVQSLSDVKLKGGLIFETTHKRKDGSTLPVEISAKFIEIDNDTGIYESIVRDITKRKVVEEHKNRIKRLYSTLSAVNQTIVRINTEEAIYNRVCEVLITEGGFNYAWIGIKDKDSDQINALAYSGDAEKIVKNIRITYTEGDYGSGPSGRAVREKQCIAVNDFKTDPNLAAWRNVIEEYNINSGASVPIFRNNEIFGVFTVYSTEKEAFLKEEIDLLDEIGSDISFALNQIDKERVRVKIERELEKSEKKYRILMETSNDIFWSVNKEGFITEISPASKKLFGKKPEEMIGTRFSEYIPANDLKNTENLFAENLRENRIATDSDSVVLGKNGNFIFLRSNVYPIKNENDEVIGLWGASKDITEEIVAHQKLKESEEKFRRIAENAEDIIFSFKLQPEFELQYINQSVERLTGFSPEENYKNPRLPFEIAHPDDQQKALKLLTGKADSNEAVIRVHDKNKKLIYLQFIVVNVYNSKNDLIAVEGIARDITERIEYEDELKAAKEQAEEMNQLKSRFLANMSHELRTPMVGILGYSEILNEMTVDEEMKEMTKLLLKSGQRLNDTLNSILDLSKIETDSTKFELTPCNLNFIIPESHKLFSPVADNHGLSLDVKLESNSSFVNADPALLLKAINNLVSNAIKFTKSGGITIKTSDSDDKKVRITVSDTGIGIPEEKLNLIFEPFRQVSEGFNRSFEGSGLGLSVTKKYIELMNGKLLVESKEGEGSSFTIELPVSRERVLSGSDQETEDINEPQEIKKRLRILHVEDDETSAAIIKTILSPTCNIDQADSGEDGILLAVANNYDLILMDISLRGKYDGLDTIAEIRKMERYKDTPIIALTAHAMTDDKEKFLNSGCDDYLSKPFKRKELLGLLERNTRL